MLPLLALIGSGASLVDGLDSVRALDRLSLVVDPALSDLASPSVESYFSLLDEDDSIGNKVLDDFRIEHDTDVNRVIPQVTDPSSALPDVTDYAVIQQGSDQAFPCWSGAPGITYSEFAAWLGSGDQFAEQSSLRALAHSFPFDVGYLAPDGVAGRPLYEGIVNDRFTRWLDDRIEGVFQSAFDLESPASSGSACEQPCRLHTDVLSTEERWQGLSAIAELLRGGLIIVGLDEPYGSGARAGRLACNFGKASPAQRRCNHLGCARSNKEPDLHDQWRVRRENHRYLSTDAGLFFADGQPGSQLVDDCTPGK